MSRLAILLFAVLLVAGCAGAKDEGTAAKKKAKEETGQPGDDQTGTSDAAGEPGTARRGEKGKITYRFSKALMEDLDEADDVEDEGRDAIEETLKENNPLLHKFLGSSAKERIIRANNPRPRKRLLPQPKLMPQKTPAKESPDGKAASPEKE